jgi:signal transduction histidine kinase
MDIPVQERDTTMRGAPPGLVPDGDGRSVAQLKMLQSLTRTLNQLNDVHQIGEAITAELRTLIDYHNCRVHLLDDTKTLMVPIAFRGELTEYQGETFEALLFKMEDGGLTGHVAKTGVSYYTPDADNDPYAINIPGTPDVAESILICPLLYGDEVIGTVALSKLGIDQFDDEDLRLLEVLASHAAVAIVNAQLLERERQAARTSRALLAFSQALTGVHDTDSVLAEAMASIPSMVPCAAVQIYVRDRGSGAFRKVMGEGQNGDEGVELQVPAADAEQFMLSIEKPFVIPRDRVSTLLERLGLTGEPSDVLVAPIRWDPDGLGAVAIVAPTVDATFTERDLEFARGIADITSLAYGNASRFRELVDAAERLRGLDDMKNMFLDAVSHELRTPLAAVLGIALTLERKDIHLSTEDSADLLTRLADNARKLERLLADLLDLSRLVRGIVEPVRRPTDVGALVERVLANSDLFGGREVLLDLEHVVVEVDAPKVERIVENLLANSVRHTPAETTIWVRVHPLDGGALIVVEDTGNGVPSELRETIFEPFAQGPQRAAHSPGVGIGLSLVSRFAELHGGRAWVEERPGGGASFHVFLPNVEKDAPAPAALTPEVRAS